MRTWGEGGGVGGVVGGVLGGVLVGVVVAGVAVAAVAVSELVAAAAAAAACRVARGAGGFARAHTDILQDMRRRPHTHQMDCNARRQQLHRERERCQV